MSEDMPVSETTLAKAHSVAPFAFDDDFESPTDRLRQWAALHVVLPQHPSAHAPLPPSKSSEIDVDDEALPS